MNEIERMNNYLYSLDRSLFKIRKRILRTDAFDLVKTIRVFELKYIDDIPVTYISTIWRNKKINITFQRILSSVL